jgi:Domain of unknown function (DUF4907)
MKPTDKRKKRILYPLFFILLAAFSGFVVLQLTSSSHRIKVTSIQVNGGWGYQIWVNDMVYIDQPFIPIVPGRKAFPDKKSAIRTGNLVKHKLLHNQSPALTRTDFEKLGLDSLLNTN